MPQIPLDPPRPGSSPLEDALRARRSCRDFAGEGIPLGVLSRLLFAADGATDESSGAALRTAPSAGALYPLELYVVALRVEGLAPGLYRYQPAGHLLRELRLGELEGAFRRACHDQEATGGAAVLLVVTEVPERMEWKYRARTARYAALEAGAVGQNLSLMAGALGLGTVVVGAFDDGALAAALGVDPERERPLAVHPVGVPAR